MANIFNQMAAPKTTLPALFVKPPAKTAAKTAPAATLGERSNCGKKRWRRAQKKKRQAAEIERAVHFLRRVARFIDTKGNWIGPPAVVPGKPEDPRIAVDRSKLAEVAKFCADKKEDLDEIQLLANQQAKSQFTDELV